MEYTCTVRGTSDDFSNLTYRLTLLFSRDNFVSDFCPFAIDSLIGWGNFCPILVHSLVQIDGFSGS